MEVYFGPSLKWKKNHDVNGSSLAFCKGGGTMNLQSNETNLIGKWIFDGGKTWGDEVCKRIEYLVSHVLDQLSVSKKYGAWETLFRDPSDGRLWERTYPQGHMHGGGPPELKVISEKEARRKYDF